VVAAALQPFVGHKAELALSIPVSLPPERAAGRAERNYRLSLKFAAPSDNQSRTRYRCSLFDLSRAGGLAPFPLPVIAFPGRKDAG
jgi:hypothetical protein